MAAAMMTELYLSKNRRLGLFWASPRLPFRVCGLKVWVDLAPGPPRDFRHWTHSRLLGHIPVLPLPSFRRPLIQDTAARLKSRWILRGRKS